VEAGRWREWVNLKNKTIDAHDMVTKLINHYILRLKDRYAINSSKGKRDVIRETPTGGLMVIREREKWFRYEELINSFEKWRDNVWYAYIESGCKPEDIERVIESLVAEVYVRVFQRMMPAEDEKFWCEALNSCASKIENLARIKGILKKVLENIQLFEVDILFRSWLRNKGVPNVTVRVYDENGTLVRQGLTSDNGEFKVKLLRGKNTFWIFKEKREKVFTKSIEKSFQMKVRFSIW